MVLIDELKDVTRHVVMVMSWVSIWEDGSPRKRRQLYLMEVLRGVGESYDSPFLSGVGISE